LKAQYSVMRFMNGISKNLLYVLFVASVSSQCIGQEVYMYRNEQGILVFTDKPHPDAEVISAKSKIDSIPATQIPQPPKKAPEKTIIDYQINILQPQAHQTFRNNQNQIHLSINIKPNPAAEQKIAVFLDGNLVKTTAYKSVITLNQVYRGEHTLKVELLDVNGKLIASSKPVIFYMHQASILHAK